MIFCKCKDCKESLIRELRDTTDVMRRIYYCGFQDMTVDPWAIRQCDHYEAKIEETEGEQ